MSKRRGAGVAATRFVLGLLAAFSVGCATRSSIRVDRFDRPSAPGAKLVEVTDRRTFPASLKLTTADKTRAVAVSGDDLVLLDAPQTVSSLVGSVVATGLRESGMLAGADPPRVTVEVEQFWGATTEEMTTRLGFSVDMKVTAPVGALRSGKRIEAGTNRGVYYPPIAQMFGGPRDEAWKRVIQEACADAAAQIAAYAHEPGPATSGSTQGQPTVPSAAQPDDRRMDP